jgi:hypothetical protein
MGAMPPWLFWPTVPDGWVMEQGIARWRARSPTLLVELEDENQSEPKQNAGSGGKADAPDNLHIPGFTLHTQLVMAAHNTQRHGRLQKLRMFHL